jgi:NhaP-type Na+/H+ or K+/H+ antiporter
MEKLLFRIISGILCILTLSFGILVLVERINQRQFNFDTTFKAGIAALAWGVITLVMTIRGR